jgi:hypothetical protein
MLGIKYACLMKKMMTIKIKQNRRNKVIIINNIKNSREIYFLIRRNKT